jgi:hypothetical protein
MLLTTICSFSSYSTFAAEHAGNTEINPDIGTTIQASDGFDLWFEAWGEGPGIIFLARFPDENRALAESLSDTYRVMLFEPRIFTLMQKQVLNKLTEEQKAVSYGLYPSGQGTNWDPMVRNTNWNPLDHENFPMELLIEDLHLVADAAGLDDFLLAGYSATARLSALLVPNSERAIGMIIGGFPILNSAEYWAGHTAGSTGGLIPQIPSADRLDVGVAHFNRQMSVVELNRNQDEAFGQLNGPKIIWYGGEDGTARDIGMSSFFWGARNADRIRRDIAQYEALGFQVFELPGLTHNNASLAVDEAAQSIRVALESIGYE